MHLSEEIVDNMNRDILSDTPYMFLYCYDNEAEISLRNTVGVGGFEIRPSKEMVKKIEEYLLTKYEIKIGWSSTNDTFWETI